MEIPEEFERILRNAYEAAGFSEEDEDNCELSATFEPGRGVQALAPIPTINVMEPPAANRVPPLIGGLVTLALLVPLVEDLEAMLAEDVASKTLKRVALPLAKIHAAELPTDSPEPQPVTDGLGAIQRKTMTKKKTKVSGRIRIYGYSRRPPGINTIRPPSRPR